MWARIQGIYQWTCQTEKGKAHEVSRLHKELKATRKPRSCRNCFPGEEHTNLLSSASQQNKTKQNRTHIGSIICTQQIIFRNVYAYVHPITISERKDHEFEGEQEGVYGMAWKEEKEGKLL